MGHRTRLQGIAADLSTAAGCEAIIARLPELDVLVNNMGVFEPKPFAEITDADWLRFFETNVLSGIRLARVAAMIAYVCSVPASATTGAALRVDGGVVRAIA